MKILIYETKVTGKAPFSQWLEKLDVNTRAVIRTRLDRVSAGNFGDCRHIKSGEGVWEFRIDYGPGYRIYFGKKGAIVVMLLCAGNKSSQDRDIEKAKKLWREAKELL